MKEEWRRIPGWDLYEISNLGRLKGTDRVIKNNQGSFVRRECLLKPIQDKHGYLTHKLIQDGKRKDMKLHRAVAMAFIPNPENKPCVNHIDNNPANNRVDNLEWCTMQENTDWMIKQGRFKRTTQWLERLHKSQRPTYKPVIGVNVQTGEKIYFERLNAVKEAGFCPSNVCKCCKGLLTDHKGYRWKYALEDKGLSDPEGS